MREFKPEIEWVLRTSIIPFERNSKAHSLEQIDQIANSIHSFGWAQAIAVGKNNVVLAGHGRLFAAEKLNLDKVPIIRMEHLSDEEERAYRISDNRTNESPWNLDFLRFEMGALKSAGLDLKLTGFPEHELGDFLETGFIPEDVFGPRTLGTEFAEGKGSRGPVDGEDDVPEARPTTTIKRGDIFRLGNHRLMCGDSTDRGDVEQLMGGEKAQLISTDPPYGINHVATSQEKGQSQGYAAIQNDDKQDEELKDFIYRVITVAIEKALAPNFAFYMWHAMKMQAYFSQAAAAAAAAGILFHRQIIWVKPQFVFGRGHYHWRHELCLMGWLQGNEPPFYGERNQSTVWEIGRENDKIHPTQKPVRISEIPIENHTKPGESVYDPFGGSGSTLIACEKMKRRCFMMELDPVYVQTIVDRWESFSGRKAEQIASGPSS